MHVHYIFTIYGKPMILSPYCNKAELTADFWRNSQNRVSRFDVVKSTENLSYMTSLGVNNILSNGNKLVQNY